MGLGTPNADLFGCYHIDDIPMLIVRYVEYVDNEFFVRKLRNYAKEDIETIQRLYESGIFVPDHWKKIGGMGIS